jgi:hypothetical protein
MPHPEAVPYINRKKQTLYKPSATIFEKYLYEDNYGWCLACGELCEGVEPDATRYTCDNCDNKFVFGLGYLAIIGLVG